MNMLIRKVVRGSNLWVSEPYFEYPTNFTFFVLIFSLCVITLTQAASCDGGGNFRDAIATERGEIQWVG